MMNNPIPLYINEHQSDIRGVKDGWYAMDQHGNLSSGPFSSHDECLERITQPMVASYPIALRRRPM